MTVSITIDGRKLRVEEGMNLLEAALQNGIYIPHLCHHPDLPDLGSCRLCLCRWACGPWGSVPVHVCVLK